MNKLTSSECDLIISCLEPLEEELGMDITLLIDKIERYRNKVNKMLTKNECLKAYDDFEEIVSEACEKNSCNTCSLKRNGKCIKGDVENIFEQLINEHFDNLSHMNTNKSLEGNTLFIFDEFLEKK